VKFHEALALALADQGVTHVFGVLGDANLFIMDSFQRLAGGRYVSVANEAAAVLAANGYARIGGGLGVATVTHGPGLTNTITALVESVKDRTPVLLIAGDTAVTDRDNLQNIAQREIVFATGAGFEQLRAPETLAEDLSMAVRRAYLEGRPVVLDVPADFQWQEADYRPASARVIAQQAVRPDVASLDAALGVIAAARRPVVLAGRGAATKEARASLLRVAQRIGAPVATTLRGKDLFRGYAFNLGIFGSLSHPVALETIVRSDCVIAFGAALNKWTTVNGSLLPKRGLVHVDRASINRWSSADAGVVGDAVVVADAIVAMLDEAEAKPTAFASPELAERLAGYDEGAFADHSTDRAVDVRTALVRLDRAFPSQRNLVLDAGRWILTAYSLLHVTDPGSHVHTANFGSIGLGMGNAIGASFAAPEHPTLMVTGDGGFALGGIAEFNTAVRHSIDLVAVVLNDAAYGAEYVQFRDRGMDPSISTFAWPDFASLAAALGGEGYTASNLDELDRALAAIPGRRRPMLIDIRIDAEKVEMGAH
jgi:thiamine pyrophosphate-dependent acetolactate synthase large subunit-like protein